MRVCLARECLNRYQQITGSANSFEDQVSGNAMQAAVDHSLSFMKVRIEGFGGIIAIGPKQEIGIGFTTIAMYDQDGVNLDLLSFPPPPGLGHTSPRKMSTRN